MKKESGTGRDPQGSTCPSTRPTALIKGIIVDKSENVKHNPENAQAKKLQGVSIWRRAARNAPYDLQHAVSPEPLSDKTKLQSPLEEHKENADK